MTAATTTRPLVLSVAQWEVLLDMARFTETWASYPTERIPPRIRASLHRLRLIEPVIVGGRVLTAKGRDVVTGKLKVRTRLVAR